MTTKLVLTSPEGIDLDELTDEQERQYADEWVEQIRHAGLISGEANEYAEPGYTDPAGGILFADWNYVEGPREVMRLIEKFYECEWEDEWDTCADCYRAIRTSPDCYGWLPSYWDSEDGSTCEECVKKNRVEEYIKWLCDNHHRAMTIQVPLDGWTRLGRYGEEDDAFESGMYGGQSHNPQAISELLKAGGISRMFFQIDSKGQFDIDFYVHVPDAEADTARAILRGDDRSTRGNDPAAMADKAFRAMAQDKGPIPGEGTIHYTKINLSDGTYDSRMVSGDELAAGIE